jgi:hypothetical protein
MIMGGRAGHADDLAPYDAGSADEGRDELEIKGTKGGAPADIEPAPDPVMERRPRFHRGTWMWVLCGLFVLAAILVTILSR